MIDIAIYTRHEGGTITFDGVQQWESVEQLAEYYHCSGYTAEQEELVGWPDSSVTWLRNLGYVVRPR